MNSIVELFTLTGSGDAKHHSHAPHAFVPSAPIMLLVPLGSLIPLLFPVLSGGEDTKSFSSYFLILHALRGRGTLKHLSHVYLGF